MGSGNPDVYGLHSRQVLPVVWRCIVAVGLLVAWFGSAGSALAASANGGIVFPTGGFLHARIFVAAPDGTSPVQITFGPGGDDDPAVSPSGNLIAFSSSRTGNDDVYVMNPDGTGLVRLTTNPAEENQPSWSPDGARIAYTRCGARDCDVWVMKRRVGDE